MLLRFAVLLAVLVGLVAIGAYAVSLDTGASQKLLSERGPVERASPLLYLAGIAAMPFAFGLRGAAARWYVAVVLAFFAFRELDLDKSLFTLGLLKSRQYLSDTPVMEKVVGLAIIGLLAASAVAIAVRHGRSWVVDVFRGRAWAWATGLALFFLVTSKTVDGPMRKLAPWGITIDAETKRWIVTYEEIAELGAAVCLLLAVVFLIGTGASRTKAKA